MNTDEHKTILTYIKNHPVATVGTVNPDGSPHGAVVYVCSEDRLSTIYFLTKQDTKKYKNLSVRSRVSITIVDLVDNSTLQAEGRAFTVRDPATIDAVMKKIAHEHVTAKEWLPPIAKLRAGMYEVVGVELLHVRLAQFKGMTIGDEHIFIGGDV